jgi:glycosyltransferase involved in cell wall biosynthesis
MDLRGGARAPTRGGVKALHVVSCRGWSSDAYWAARVCRELDRAGHEATLVCKRGSEKRVMARARAEGVSRMETLALGTGLKPAGDLDDVRRLAGLLDGTDIVHVHRGKEHWLAALANRARARRRPLVRTRHIVQPLRAHPLNRWLYGQATDLVVTVSEAIARQCVAGGLAARDRVVAIPGGADGEKFRPGSVAQELRQRLALGDATPLIGLVSGFRVMKGQALVVEAAIRLARQGRKFHIVFAGVGPFVGQIRSAVEAAGLREHVSFLGFVDDTADVVGSLDIALYSPLESDGMSRVLFEYLAAGRAVVASRVGAAAEVLTDGGDALLVPGGDVQELAGAMGRLLDDAPLRARLGLAAGKLAHARFTGARVAERLLEHYHRLSARS